MSNDAEVTALRAELAVATAEVTRLKDANARLLTEANYAKRGEFEAIRREIAWSDNEARRSEREWNGSAELAAVTEPTSRPRHTPTPNGEAMKTKDRLDQYGEMTLAMAQSHIAAALRHVKKKDVAKRLGVSPSYLSNLQKGETDLTMRQLGRVLAAAGVEVRFWLVPASGKQPPTERTR